MNPILSEMSRFSLTLWMLFAEGYACAEGGSADAIPCTCQPGKFCPVGSTQTFGRTCNAGSFCIGGHAGNQSCSSAPGYYCPEGFSDPTGIKCPGGFFCEGGDALKQPCTAPPGKKTMFCCKKAAIVVCYKVACRIIKKQRDATELLNEKISCDCMSLFAGRFCFEGSVDVQGNTDCDVGWYCIGFHLMPQACIAEPGNYCPAKSSEGTGVRCPAGFFCEGFQADKMPCSAQPGSYCPEGSPAPEGVPCPVGHYCTGAQAAPAPCEAEPGSFCPVRSEHPEGVKCPVSFW